MVVNLWNTTQHYRRGLLTTFTADDYAIAHAHHRPIVGALKSGNARGGEELVRLAMETSRLRLIRNRHLFDT